MSGTSLGEFALLSRLLGKKVRLSLRSQTGFLNITRTSLYHDASIVTRSQLENGPLGCGETGKLHHKADKSAATV